MHKGTNLIDQFIITRDNYKNLLIMLIAVILMGFSLSLLVMTNFGTDPCSAMNYGVCKIFGLSFGTYQLLMNLVLLVFVLFFHRSSLGWGTIGNMVLVGYTTDLFTFVWHDVCHIPYELTTTIRVAILVPALLLFVFAAAFYMQSGQGVAPYDAIPFILDDVIQKRNGGKSHFRPLRLCQDFFCTMIGVLTGGTYGILTFLMVILLAPTVQFVGDLFHKKSNSK
jgi:uncharacterized membrane protein YczE